MMISDREQQILRLLDAGVRLTRRANASEKFGAVFDFSRVAATVLRPTLVAMLQKQLIRYDKESGQYHLTNDGRDRVAVRTRVRDFASQQEGR